MRMFIGLAVIVSTAAEAVHFGAPVNPFWAPTLSPRDSCAELPPLCTGQVMMYGSATTLTYLCPETAAPSTVHVTVTTITTVTALPGDDIKNPPIAPSPAEPMTTTTLRSTSTQYKTIIVTHKKQPMSETTAPTLTITITSSVTSLSSQAGDSFTVTRPILPSHSNVTSKALNSTSSVCLSTAIGSSITSSSPIYSNSTTSGHCNIPSGHIMREMELVDSLKGLENRKTGGVGQMNVSFIELVLSTVVAAFFLA
ncbi:hypothetical protein GQ44DRAFT_821675 [Phaeosphaeriaceae sp. PMI808]|nr:hypothetical protein GQ44DRAFT_821675 [Phaeosphaeriaceae sp. PMI808]